MRALQMVFGERQPMCGCRGRDPNVPAQFDSCSALSVSGSSSWFLGVFDNGTTIYD